MDYSGHRAQAIEYHSSFGDLLSTCVYYALYNKQRTKNLFTRLHFKWAQAKRPMQITPLNLFVQFAVVGSYMLVLPSEAELEISTQLTS